MDSSPSRTPFDSGNWAHALRCPFSQKLLPELLFLDELLSSPGSVDGRTLLKRNLSPALLPGTAEAFCLVTFTTCSQGMPWAAPVTVSWGCDLRPHRSACLCVYWVEDAVGKPSQFCQKADAPVSSQVNSLGCEGAERGSVHSRRQRAPTPSSSAPLDLAEKGFNEQGFAATEFKSIW